MLIGRFCIISVTHVVLNENLPALSLAALSL